MEINRKKKAITIKRILLILVPILFLVGCLFYIKKDIKLDNKWISATEIQEQLNLGMTDYSYMYCSSYNDIRNEKFKNLLLLLLFICCISVLIMYIGYLLKKLNKQNNVNKYEKIKNMKQNSIISKFKPDDVELQTQQILNDEFINNVYNMFCDLQIACMNYDYKTLQKLLTNELYDNYRIGLEVSESKFRRNVVDDFEFISIKFVDINEDDKKYSIKVNLKVEFLGYIEDTKTKEIIKGKKDEKIVNTYMLNLIKYKNEFDNCQICGAPVENNINDNCEYCKSKIIKNSSDWLISEKEKVN